MTGSAELGMALALAELQARRAVDAWELADVEHRHVLWGADGRLQAYDTRTGVMHAAADHIEMAGLLGLGVRA